VFLKQLLCPSEGIMADHSELAIQHLGVLTVPSTPAQIAAALASASAAEMAPIPMEVDGTPDIVEGVPSSEVGLGMRNRLNSFVAGQSEDPLTLLSSSNVGSAGLSKVPKAVVSDEEDEEEEEEDNEVDAESTKASFDVSRIIISLHDMVRWSDFYLLIL
jgi:hypothetical protein